ncbi:hypothetical protein AC792_00610 [Arthrobacter sp. RIT-PI-e]|uniref:3-oxo-tetronate kinase n=1 Tax=Arthrobacter sp. RIT-PI-e TaxID=1681197 RepID=UPI0006A1EDAA|nr:3-oxo-tetronate kinase [Arthrobacter sp. RIT-PI-e]KNC20454.1 hypothetical protein AC792_00610 [Arthrobacter sp. RIT-PI-e]
MLGVIADDVTGGTDVALSFTKAGLSTLVIFGQPQPTDAVADHQVVVIALKTRTMAPAEAVGESLTAATWLQEHGATQLFFKYCSTFDSSPAGNIGQVADALAACQQFGITVIVPAPPQPRRTQYMGNLFVAQQPLAESPMQHHPLTPMRDSNVLRLLSTQTSRPITLIDHDVVRAGSPAIRQALDNAAAAGIRYAVIDAITDEDLEAVGAACLNDRFLTGAAGLAAGLGAALATTNGRQATHHDPVGAVPAAVLAGSCSARTREQVAYMRDREPSYFLDVRATPDPAALAAAALTWFDTLTPGSVPLIYSTMDPARLTETQQHIGVARSAEILETATGIIARGLHDRGVRRIIIAGGETSGAVVDALDIRGGIIGQEMAPGVPWIYTTEPHPTALLLKSGNFGEQDLLVRAARAMPPTKATNETADETATAAREATTVA